VSIFLVLFAETIWIEDIWIRKKFRIVVESIDRDDHRSPNFNVV
jgi:hypothetical protein